jgi:ABC-type multidrug transport system fused ATPase/permease subunit
MKKKFLAIALLCMLMLQISCSYLVPTKSELQARYDIAYQNQVVAAAGYVSAAKDVVEILSFSNQTSEVLVSENLLTKAESLLPRPAIKDRIDVHGLLSTNKSTLAKANTKLKDKWTTDVQRDERIVSLKKQVDTEDRKVDALAAKYEEANNKQIWWKFWTWTGSTLVIGGIIAACVFFPALIPVVLAVVRMIINTFVSFIQWLVPAFSRTIKGISNFKTQLNAEAEANKALPPDKKITYTPEEVSHYLGEELKKATDEKDKEVISKLKTKIKA